MICLQNMRKIIACLVLMVFLFPQNTFASTAQAEAEANVEASGNIEVRQSVETTINGQTVKKESNSPGKLELKMEQSGNSSAPTVSFSQTSTQEPTPTPETKISPTPEISPIPQNETPTTQFVSWISEFAQKLLTNLTSWFK
ncbi:MAG: hypothetical protein U1C56_01850 [Candidatus Curtissbacteria bacterium]|nr:hypothetical protein [Candidatus Curtissbacteria bacterium]